MNETQKVYLLFTLYLIQLILDLSTNECLKRLEKGERLKTILILIFHHIISVFGHFGWIFNNRKVLIVYILGNISILIHWMMHKGCIVTEMFNKLCGYQGYEYFHDILYFLNLKKLSPVIMIVGLLIAVYKLA